jgi:protocatechuate 3,4-dioxygenase beta subunit
MQRPVLLGALAALAVGCLLAAPAPGRAAPSCAPTTPDSFGPFGRGMPPLRGKIGSGHVLEGVVLSALDCNPIRGARVELWQANSRGRYTRATSATVLTNRAGRFRFEGPYPPRYSSEPHIHLRVVATLHQPLLTRYVPREGARRGTVRLVLEPEEL